MLWFTKVNLYVNETAIKSQIQSFLLNYKTFEEFWIFKIIVLSWYDYILYNNKSNCFHIKYKKYY